LDALLFAEKRNVVAGGFLGHAMSLANGAGGGRKMLVAALDFVSIRKADGTLR